MDLRKINLWLYLLCFGFGEIFCSELTSSDSSYADSSKNRLDDNANDDLRDFHYTADLQLEEESGLFNSMTDMISESEISTEIKQLRTFDQQDKTINSMKALDDRVGDDVKNIHQKLHRLGFFESKVHHEIRVKNRKAHVKMRVIFGQIFNLKLNIHYQNQSAAFNEKYAAVMMEKLRMFKASIPEVKALMAIALKDLQRDGFFEPQILQKTLSVNHEAKNAVLNLVIDPGKKVTFADLEIAAFPGIDEEFIKNRIDWREGEIFDIEKVEFTAENLKNTRIFSEVKIEPVAERVTKNGVPMRVELLEDKKHMVDITLLYSGMRNMNFEKKSQTQKRLKSIIGRLSWSRYNAFGGGEKLTFILEGTPLRVRSKRADYGFEAALSQPDVILRNNTVNYAVSRRQELTNVFFKKSDRIGLICNYPLNLNLLLNIGGNVERNYVDGPSMFFQSEHQRKNYENFSVPLELILDKTDDLLNPSSGYRMFARFSRMFLRHSSAHNIMDLDVGFSYYYPLDQLKKTVVAFNIFRKSIFGCGIDDIPLDKRIYAGGMNSVRGYANQMATEMVLGEDTPMGGKSSIEFNSEIRRKITKDFGIVLFFDGARIFQNNSSYEKLKTERKRWFFSVGVGIRYFTTIGPIRVDFAFPIKRRKGIASRMQFVISLGQAF
jgi:translocation and assembly module TamA